MVVYLIASGTFQTLAICSVGLLLAIIMAYSDKFILAYLQAREIIDSDNPQFFQLLKAETYRAVEEYPSVYIYSGNRPKAFALGVRNSWSLVIERSLFQSLKESQARSLIRHLIAVKQKKSNKLQVLGMGISATTIKFCYWIVDKIPFKSSQKKYKSITFILFIFLKPFIELILKISINSEKILCEDDLKPICLQANESINGTVKRRTFIEFMLMHLETDISFKDCLVEFLEIFPLLENCKFRESV